MSPTFGCSNCDYTGWVCENHPDRPWADAPSKRGDACACGAGAPFRHAFATWMRRAGADVQGLVATGNWRDPRSAARNAHAVAREEWARVESLPAIGEKSGEEVRDAT